MPWSRPLRRWAKLPRHRRPGRTSMRSSPDAEPFRALPLPAGGPVNKPSGGVTYGVIFRRRQLSAATGSGAGRRDGHEQERSTPSSRTEESRPRSTGFPGEVLHEEFLLGRGINQRALALAIAVPPIRISEIVRGKRAVSADTAMRFAAYFGTSPEFWLNLQSQWELAQLRQARPDDYSFIARGPSPAR